MLIVNSACIVLAVWSAVSWAVEGASIISHTHSNLETSVAIRRLIPQFFDAPGHLRPQESSSISSRVTGFIQEVAVDVGQTVEAGHLLVIIDSSHVEREIAEADASLQAARAELMDADREVTRSRTLVERSAVSRERMEKGLLRQERARAEVARFAAVSKSAREERQYVRMVAPYRARVVKRLADSGTLAIPGTHLLELQRIDTPLFETRVPGRLLVRLSLDSPVQIWMDGLTAPLEGRVASVVDALEPESGTALVRVRLPGSVAGVVGTFGRLQCVIGEENGVVVPENTLVQRAGIEGVFLLNQDGVIHFRSVRTGRKLPEGRREILAGLDGGEQIIVKPSSRLRDGDLAGQP
ncbi:MAG: efflux RND transporter periplasmic adaptor subunit [Magnetococcus sp. YQC-5]